MNQTTKHRFTRSLLVAAALLGAGPLSAADVVTNWVAYNDHVPSTITATNANRYNLRGVAGTPPEPVAGYLKDFVTGFDTPAYIMTEATGAPDYFGTMANPNAGTPAYNLFNGIVDVGNVNSGIGLRSSANTTTTITISNLNSSQRYHFRGTSARGGSYLRRWTLASLRGAASFTDAHTPGVFTAANFPTGTMTNGQAAFDSGENREGDMVGWDNIDPGPDGVITIKCEQYIDNPLPNGQTPDLGAYGYGFNSLYLVEVGEPTPVTFTVQLPSTLVVEQNRTLTLTGLAQGAPSPSYQWYKEGVGALAGATTRTYSIPSAQPSDSGNYYLVAANSLNTVTSVVAAVTVFADTNGPAISSIRTDDTFRRIVVTWNETVAQGPAVELGNYYILGPDGNQVGVTAVSYNGSSVTLTVPTLLTGTNYSIEFDYQQDLVGNTTLPVGAPVNDPNAIVTSFNTFVIAPGFTRFQAFLNRNSAETLAQFLTLPEYPEGSTFGFYTNVLYWPQSVPNLEQYMMRFSGLFIAPEDGLYKFNPAHDDDALLRIYPTSEPTGTPSELPEVCCNDLAAGLTLDVTLAAGQSYYYELLVREFGGGDIAGVSVILPSGVTNSPISAEYLAVAFDPAQIQNVGIAQQPQNQTTEANHAATFSVVVTNGGSTLNYQWQVNTGSGFVNIAGANGASYTTPYQPLGNSGHLYRVVVSVPGRSVTSGTAALTVVTDSALPRIVGVRGVRDLNAVRITFDGAMDSNSALESGNYSLTDSNGTLLTLGTPTISADLLTVTIPTSAQTPGASYTLHAETISDLAGNLIETTNITFPTWVFSRGFVLKELYLGLSASSVAIADLRASPKYPTAPDIVRYGDTVELNTFDEFEGYGARLSGVFLPPVSGNYTFYMSSDDNGELWLSDASPAGITNIAREPVYAGRRIWTGESAGGSRVSTPSPSGGPQANISGAINLVAGQMYYFEALVKEGGGGDNLAVAWRLPGGPEPVNGSLNIPGVNVAALADPVGASVGFAQQPSSLTATQGQVVNLIASAQGTNVNGSAPVFYQWQRLVGGTYVDIAGANNSNYVTAALSAGDNGAQFRVLAFIPGASATSSAATITIGGGAPSLRSSFAGGVLTFNWDAPARLQCTTSLTPPVVWQDIDTGGATTYTVNPSNQFNILLDAAQSGGGGRTGTGSGTLTLSGNNLLVDVVYSGLSADRNNDHFHAPAARGANAGVAYGTGAIATGTRAGTIKGTIPMADGAYGGKNIAAQLQDLRSGLWYLNIHTTAFTGGEIRGQVDPAGARFYRLVSP